MIGRDISAGEVIVVLNEGETISDYPADKPYQQIAVRDRKQSADSCSCSSGRNDRRLYRHYLLPSRPCVMGRGIPA